MFASAVKQLYLALFDPAAALLSQLLSEKCLLLFVPVPSSVFNTVFNLTLYSIHPFLLLLIKTRPYSEFDVFLFPTHTQNIFSKPEDDWLHFCELSVLV